MAVRRAGADRCPGALVLHEAADGGLARIRLPGGLIRGDALAALAALADSLGPRGALEITSRGNVQLRGVPVDRRVELADRVAGLGLLPSATHERVRNIVAAPYAGLTADGCAGGERLDELIRALDLALCADPELAGLSGRFLFGLDDGSGEVGALAPDAWAAPTAGDRWWIGPAGVEVETAAVVPLLLAAARAFLRATAGDQAGSPAWRVRDLPDGGARLAAALRAGRPVASRPAAAPAARPLGVWRRPDGASAGAVQVPLGTVTRPAAELLAAAGPDLRVTPWRSIVVPCLADPASFAAAARRAGLVVDPGSLWARVTACAGRPGCASALADVRADAARAVAAGRLTTLDTPEPARAGARAHWSGCARRCGRPEGPHVDVLASPGGYLVRDAGAEPKESPRW